MRTPGIAGAASDDGRTSRLALAAAALLIAASFLSGVALPVGSLEIRPEQVVPPLVLLAFLARELRPFPRVGLLAALWIAVGLFSASGQLAPERAGLHAVRLAVTVLPVFLLPALLSRRDAERAWDVFLGLASVEAAISLLAFASHELFGTSWGVFTERYLFFVHPMGTLLEPNLLGAVSAMAALPLLLRLLSPTVPLRGKLLLAAPALLLVAALAFSVTRAAWVALPFSLAVTLSVEGLVGPGRAGARRTALRLAAVASVFALSLGAAAAALRLPERFETRTGIAGKLATLLRPARDPNVRARLRTYSAALSVWRTAPAFGAGHGAMERIPGTEDRTLAWAGNLEIHLLADTGIAGLALVLGFVCAVVGRTLDAVRQAAGEARRRHLERLGALLVLLVCAQATETSWLGCFWVLFGLALAALPAPPRPAGPLRVLYVHPSDELYGSDRVLLDVVRTLDRARVSPLVVLSSDVPYAGRLSRRFAALGVPARRMRLGVLRRQVLTSPGRLLRYTADVAISTVRLARLMGVERIDVVHANTVTVFPAALAARLTGRRLLWHVHEIVADRPGRAALHLLVAALSDRLVVVSRVAREALGVFGGRAEVIPNGIAPRDVVAEPAGPPIVAYAGRISRRKGPDVLLDAAARIADRHPTVRFVLAGDEFGGGDALSRELLEKARALGLADRVELRPFDEDVSPLLAEASIVVSPSIEPESFGLVLLEAMASARPVVASRLGGPMELVVDGETGLLVPPGDPAALAAALDRLLADPAFARRLGEAGLRRSREVFSLERQAVSFERVYGEMGKS